MPKTQFDIYQALEMRRQGLSVNRDAFYLVILMLPKIDADGVRKLIFLGVVCWY